MSASTAIKDLISGNQTEKSDAFWQRFTAAEAAMRTHFPLIPFTDKRPPRGRLVFQWTGTRIEPVQPLSLPLPSAEELDGALSAFLETAAGAALVIESQQREAAAQAIAAQTPAQPPNSAPAS